jgi:hypothetical protein
LFRRAGLYVCVVKLTGGSVGTSWWLNKEDYPTYKMPCSSCRQSGHNKTTCPNKKSSATPKIEITSPPTPKSSIVDRAIEKFYEFVSKIENSEIVLLRRKEVIQWLFGDLSFLPEIEKKNKKSDEEQKKILEDRWGRAMMKKVRPDLKLEKQWTNLFGELITKELYILQGKVPKKPEKKGRHQPDLEVDVEIIEAKAQTFFTSGTAGEKILGCPFKYADIPDLYGKPLKILCMGGAEKVCRENYGNLPGVTCSPQKKKFLDFFRENRIEYIGASDILRSLSS